jgi:hypothetical protein
MGYNIKQNADGSTSLVNEADSVETFKLDKDGHVTVTRSSSSTSGSSSVQPFRVLTTMTGAGGVGGRGYFKLDTNVALGGWSNALKGEVVYGASGRTAGLGSAILAEMQLSAGTTSGSYAPLEIELGLGTGAKTGTRSSFMSLNVYGAAAGEFDDAGFLFDLNGVTIGSTHLVQASAVSDINSTHAIKIQINGTTYYLPAHTAANFGG